MLFSRNKSRSTTTYTSTDTRGVADNGSVLITGSNNALNIESVDSEIAKAAFDFAAASDASAAEGFDKLLQVAGDVFDRGQSMIGLTQQSVLDAYAQAEADKSKTIDNRTIIILALAAAGALVLVKIGKKG